MKNVFFSYLVEKSLVPKNEMCLISSISLTYISVPNNVLVQISVVLEKIASLISA